MDRIVDRHKNMLLKNKRHVNAAVAFFVTVVMIFTSVAVTADTIVSTLDLSVLEEGFEDPWEGDPLAPPEWRVIATQPGNFRWHQTTVNPYDGAYAARVLSRPMFAQNEWLISPPIDLTNIPVENERILFVFYGHGTRPSMGSIGDVTLYVDVDNSNTFPDPNDDLLWSLKAEAGAWTDNQWNIKVFSLDTYRGTVIRLAWRYNRPGSESLTTFYLDKISVFSPMTLPSVDFGEIAYGSSLSVRLKNTGPFHVHNITWTASVKGGIMGGINLSAEGAIPRLNKEGWSDDVTTVSLGQNIRGFGRVDITFTADSEDLEETVVRNAIGFVVLNKCYPILFYDKPWFNIFL